MQSSLSYSTCNNYTKPYFTFHHPNPISIPTHLHFRLTKPSSQSFSPKIPKLPFTSLTPLLSGISSNSYNAPEAEPRRSLRGVIEATSEAVSNAFPIWVTLGCLLGLLRPNSFRWVTPRLNVIRLTLTMLGMGMTLTLGDLKDALAMPKQLFIGFALQYSVMPLSGYFVSRLLNLPAHYAAGLILVACCPGGTASDIVTYIALGNVALSVLMTAASTVSAVIMTPFLTAKLAGQYVAVDVAGMLFSTLQVALLPVIAGAFLNQYFQSLVKFVSPLMPPIAVTTVGVLCGNAIVQSSSAILSSGPQVVLASSLLLSSGFFFGYLLSRLLGLDVASSRTISIEVGMQGTLHATKSLFGPPPDVLIPTPGWQQINDYVDLGGSAIHDGSATTSSYLQKMEQIAKGRRRRRS